MLTHTGGVAGPTTLTWTAPRVAGGTSVVYSTMASSRPDDFVIGLFCVESGDGSDTTATVTAQQHIGMLRFFLVRAENGCGVGSLGQWSDGTPRVGGPCP